MLRNYLMTALRSLWREKGSTILNLSGLTLGIASSLILFLLVRHLSSYDQFHAKHDRIYRVVTQSEGNHGLNYTSGIPPVLPDAFRTDFPEAQEVTFTSYQNGGLVTLPQPTGESKRYEEERGIAYAPSNYFKIFDRRILAGTISGLDQPNQAALSKKLALKYFGKESALGEIVNFNGKEYKVIAVMEDYPSNTDFPFELILSYITVKKERDENGWNSIWSDEQCYFLLKEGESIAEVERRMVAFTKKYRGDDTKSAFTIQPLEEIHFDDRYGNYSYNTVSKGMLSVLGVIAIFLILTACINFINLSTAEAIKRSKEVGIRKSLGSSRGQLIAQFLGESALVTAFAVILAMACAQIALTFLNPFLNFDLSISFLSDPGLCVFVATVSVVVAGLSGLYPSLVVSGFNPVLALKNKLSNRGGSGYNLRRSLVVLQFSISQFFIIGTIVLISQMSYFQSKDLGFNKDAILTVPVPNPPLITTEINNSKKRTLREEIARINGVEKASLSNTPPSSGSVSGTNFNIEGNEKSFQTQVKLIDGDYITLYGLSLAAGENLLDLDTAQGFIVNEKLATMVGFNNPNEIVGKKIKMWGKNLPIAGVVKNFHTMSLHEPIEATIMLNRAQNYQTLSVKINPRNMQETIKQIQQKWEASYPEFIFSYRFLDESIKEFYESEQKTSVLLTIFTTMAIFIGCLGLFGLASFMANQKTKEIGVRKVLGASVNSIVFMFSKEYVKLIVIGFLLASPLAWYVMNQWLDNFAYKIEIGPSIFLSGIGLTLLIALATVGYRSFRAAVINPADSLRSE